MGRVEQSAISAVVDVERVAAALLDPDQQARIFGAKRPARLAPELGRIGDRQILERAVDELEIGFECGRLHPRIGGGEAAADVDDVDGDRRLDDRGAHPLHRLGIGHGRHRLAADVEADAERVGRLAGRDQQRLHFSRFGAELGGEAELGMFRGDADADQQLEIGRALGGADDLLQLLDRVEREGAHPMVEIGLGDRLLRLHRMHEAGHRLGKGLRDQPHLGDRRHVIMGDAFRPQDPQQVRRGIGLHRIERAARKLLNEEAGGAPGGVRTNERDRLDRALHCDCDAGDGVNGERS